MVNLLDLSILGKHVVDLVLAERLDEGSLVLPKEQLSHELGQALRLDMPRDIDLLLQTIHSLKVAIVLELAYSPP